MNIFRGWKVGTNEVKSHRTAYQHCFYHILLLWLQKYQVKLPLLIAGK